MGRFEGFPAFATSITIYEIELDAQVDTVANTSRGGLRGVLHNVAVTLGAIGSVVDERQSIGAGLRLCWRAQGHLAVRQHGVAAHRDAGAVRRLG